MLAIIAGTVAVILVIAATLIHRAANDYDAICRALQKGAFGDADANSFAPRADPIEETRADGVRVRTEIRFGDEFPNSYLDIWYPGDVDVRRPTLVYWHGGGHIFGDKNLGDPLNPASDVSSHLYNHMCKEGFNFVTVNYAFAPEYRYPVQILQYDQALAYLDAHAEELHLDMDNVVLGGSSGGAVYTSQWAMVLTSDEYRAQFNRAARETGHAPIDAPALRRDQVKALLLEAPPMIIDGMNDRTQILYKCWFGTDDMSKLWYTRLTHIADYVTADFIPSFITAGNTDCYPEDARELHDRLDSLGVENSYYYVDADVEVLNHGYLSSFETSPHAKESLDQCMDFLKERAGIQ